MRISDWSSDVCSSDLQSEVDKNLERFRFMIADPDFNVNSPAQKLDLIYGVLGCRPRNARGRPLGKDSKLKPSAGALALKQAKLEHPIVNHIIRAMEDVMESDKQMSNVTGRLDRSEEHTSELQSLMRISYAVFCLKNKKKKLITKHNKQKLNTNNNKNK